MADRALTRNASDPKQIAFAKRQNQRREAGQRADMLAALAHSPTRRLLMRILFEARCDVAHLGEDHPELSASTWDPSAKVHYHAGRRDLGLLVQSWIVAADSAALVQMVHEDLKRRQQANAEIDAAHTPPTTRPVNDYSQEVTD